MDELTKSQCILNYVSCVGILCTSGFIIFVAYLFWIVATGFSNAV